MPYRKDGSKLLPFSGLNISLAQAIIDSVSFRVAFLDSSHNVLLINKITLQKLSINPEDFIGKKCPHFRPAEKCDICPLEKAILNPSAEECEYFDPRSKRWFHSIVFPLPFSTDAGLRTFALIVIDISDKKKAEQERDAARGRYEVMAHGTIEIIQTIIGKKDPYQVEHQVEVSRLATAIAVAMGLQPSVIEGIGIAAQIHDLGKIAIPSEILMRPGRIIDQEYALIKTHPREGFDILRNVEFPFPLAEIVYQHHERINGSGYPRGLTGPDILIEAKILAVAEVVAAMSAHRPYRPALGIDDILQHIEEKRGILYDSGVVDACVRLIREKRYRLTEKE